MKYKLYDKMKYSGVEWIGEIPEHWELNRLKRVSHLYGRIGYRGYTIEDIVGEMEGAITLSPSNMVDGRLDLSKCTYISWDKYNESPEIQISDGDILIVKTGSTLGKVTIVDSAKHPMTINPQLAIFKDIIADRRYLFNYISSTYIQSQVDLSNTGGTIPTMTQETIGNYPVPYPPLTEQHTIAAFLDRETSHIDRLIEKKERLIELLKEKRQALITRAVTRGLDPTVKMKDSGVEWIGEIPEHWSTIDIKYIAHINKNALPENTDELLPIFYIDIGNVDSNGFINEYQDMTFANAPSRARRIVQKDEIIVSTVRTYLKAIAYIDDCRNNLVASTGYAVLTPQDEIYPKYLFYQMRSTQIVDEIVARSVGVSYPAINASDIGGILALLPPFPEQQSIATFLDRETSRIDSIVDKINIQINKLRELRQTLISNTVTGKIDVREEAV